MNAKIRAMLAPLFVGAVLFSGCGEQSVGDPIAAAKGHIAKRDWAAATVSLKSALQAKPDSAEARYLLGVAFLEQGEDGSAAVELAKAAQAGYDNELVAPKLARAWLGSGRAKEVIQRYGQASLTKATAQAEIKAAVAAAHAMLGQRAEAERAVDEALRADPGSPAAWLTKARLMAQAGRFDEALRLTEKAVVAGQPNGEAHLLRGWLLSLGKNDHDAAVKAFREAVLDSRYLAQARAALIESDLQRQDLVAAKSQLLELQKARPKSADTLFMTALVAYVDKDYERADGIIEQLLRVAPENTRLLMLGGAASLRRGNLIAAEARLGKIVHTVERAPFARRMLADTYMRMGQPARALQVLRPLVGAQPADGDALILAGQAHLQAGNFQEAESSFVAALKLRPDDNRLRTAMALADLARGRADAALGTLQAIAEQDAGDSADLALIGSYMSRREFDAALDAIARLEKKFPSRADVLHLRGLALRERGDMAGARTAFEAALRSDAGYYASIAALAGLDVREQRLDAAKQRFEAVVKTAPRNIAARMALIDLMARSGAKPQDLLAHIDEAIKADPSDAVPRVAKIAHLSRLNDVKAAAAAAQDAMAALPQSPDVLEAAGRALASSGDHKQAISAFSKLALAAPGSPVPFLRMAEVYSRQGEREASKSSLSRAFDVAPLAPEVHRQLLSVAAATRDYKMVAEAAKALQNRYPSSAVGYLLEGDVESSRRAWPAALSAYRIALTKTGGHLIAQRAVYKTLVSSGDRAGAERFVAEWTKARPNDTQLAEHLGGEALLRKDYESAERYLRRVVELRPRHVAAINNLAWAMAELGRPGAVEMAERAVALSPGSPPLLDTLAKALGAAGEFPRAIDVQNRALLGAPQHHEYRLNLARLYLAAGRRADASRELDVLAQLGDRFIYQSEVNKLRSQVSAAPK